VPFFGFLIKARFNSFSFLKAGTLNFPVPCFYKVLFGKGGKNNFRGQVFLKEIRARRSEYGQSGVGSLSPILNLYMQTGTSVWIT